MWCKLWFIMFVLCAVGLAYFAWSSSAATSEAQRLGDYSKVLQTNAANAADNYNTLNLQYKSLSETYTKVSTDYVALQNNYRDLVTKYNALGGK
jgi:hypothetical protein